jgi:hypothetical protein
MSQRQELAGFLKLASQRKVRVLDLERIVTDLKQERERLDRAIAALEGAKSPRAARKTSVAMPRPSAMKGRKRGGLTPEGRRRLSLAMKKRWAERKKQG